MKPIIRESAAGSDSQHRMQAYSNEQLQQAVGLYNTRFNDNIPLELLTSAASAFRSRELMSTLLDRVAANEPVRNWEEFSDRFLRD